jgi:hypothetical protein
MIISGKEEKEEEEKVTFCFEMCSIGNLPVLVTTIYSQIVTMNQPSLNEVA